MTRFFVSIVYNNHKTYSKGEKKVPKKYNLSDEEIIKIVTKARQTTLKEAAAEFGVPESLVVYLAYTKAKTMNIPDVPVAVGSLNPSKKPANDFTIEEKQAAVNRAIEVGLQQAAKEYSIPWRNLNAWKMQSSKRIPQSEPPSAHIENNAEQKELKPIVPETNELKEMEALKIENAVLKDKVETLSHQLEKLTRAIGDLTQLDIKVND